MDNANMKGNSSKKCRLYVFSVFLAVIMALSCVAIVAFDSDESSAEYTDVSTFEQLSAAVADPQGKEIRLTADISAKGAINVCEDVTLDLAGYVISPDTAFDHSGGADYIFGVKRAGSLTINDSSNPSTGKITTGTADSNFYVAVKMTVLGEAATGDVATLVVNNGTIEGNQYGISGNGNRNGTSVTINGGTVKALLTELAAGENSIGIYHPQEGTLTVTGGTISGWQSGIEIRSGNLVVSGGNISCVASPTEVAPNGNGGTVTGAAVAVAQHTTLHKIDVKISGGTFTGASAFYECNPQNNPDAAEDITMEITGGSFTGTIYSQDENGFVKGGTYSDSSCMLYLTFTSAVTYTGSDPFDPATWTAMSKSGSMWFGSVYYPFKYFSGQTATIDVLKDCEDSSFQLFTGSNITLNLNGFDITGDGYDMFYIGSDVTSASLIINGEGSVIDAGTKNVLGNWFASPAKHGFDLTVNSGTYKGDQGFILHDAGEVTISNATITSETGGVWCGNAGASDITITNCQIVSNDGPGVYFGSVGTADIIGCMIITNADDESAVEIKSGTVTIDKNTTLKAKAFGATTGDINHNGTGSGNAVVFINNAYCAAAGVDSVGVTIEKGAKLNYTGGGNTDYVYIVTDNATNPISVGWEDNTENVAFFVNKEVSVKVNGEDCKYSVVIMDSEHGAVTSSAPAGVYQQEITLTITPDTGYEIDTLTVTDADSQAVQVENNKFKIPSSNVTVTATFKLVSYTITYTNDGNGTVSGAANATYGDTVTLTISPKEGFKKKSVTYLVEGGTEPATISGTGFEMPAANVTVTATFEPITYTVTVNLTDNMSTSGQTVQVVNYGEAMTTITIVAATGYTFPEGYVVDPVNGISVARVNASEITVSGTPTADATINLVAPTLKTFVVHYEITNGVEKIDTNAGYHQAYEGTLIVANEHYDLPATVTVTMNDEPLSSYTYENGIVSIPADVIEGTIEITVVCVPEKYTVMLYLNEGYFEQTLEGWTMVDSTTYTRVYEYNSQVTAEDIPLTPAKTPSAMYTYSFVDWSPVLPVTVDKDMSTVGDAITATWDQTIRTYEVTFTDDVTVTHGSVVLSSPANVNASSELNVIAKEKAGNTATIIGVELVDGKFTVYSDVSISVQYTPIKYTVTITGEGVTVMAGTTAVKSGDKVDYGTELTATIAEKTGYIGTVDHEAVIVTSDVEIIGSYAPIKYTVAFDANGGTGTMDSMQITYDDAKALTAVAFTRADYAFAGWATAADGKAVYGDGATVSNLTATDGATVTLYAAWLQVEKKDNAAGITVTTDTVSDQAAQAVVDAAKDMGAGSVAVINATETDDVSVKSDYIKQAADSNVGVTLGTKSGSMELSAEVLKNLGIGNDATLKTEIKSVETPSGYDLGKNAVVYSILLTSDGTPYTNQFGTGFTVKLAYTPASGEDTSKLKVYYLADDGKMEEMADCQYADGFVTFTTTHLSQYAVSLDVDAKDTSGTMEFLLIFFVLIAVLIATPIIASKAKKN